MNPSGVTDEWKVRSESCGFFYSQKWRKPACKLFWGIKKANKPEVWRRLSLLKTEPTGKAEGNPSIPLAQACLQFLYTLLNIYKILFIQNGFPVMPVSHKFALFSNTVVQAANVVFVKQGFTFKPIMPEKHFLFILTIKFNRL